MKSLLILLSMCFLLNAQAAEELSKGIPYPFYAKDDLGRNQVMSITDGLAALQLRLEMIRRASKSIEVEYFIYDVDLAGKILTRELIDAAKRGVKVRILIDKSVAVFEFDEHFASALKEQGIEVRYYNKAAIYRISSVQFRNHRKLLTVDDKEAITGGRNIGEDYFDLSKHFNFNDTDIYVKGPMAKVMRESFDKFFEHKISERVSAPKVDAKKNLIVESFLRSSEEESETKEMLQTLGKKILATKKLITCPELTFVTDGPGANFIQRLKPNFDERYKFVRKTLFDKISQIDKSILISSPYLIANSHSNKLMKSLLKRNVEISIYTNSLASTDAVYVAANLYYDVFKWTKKGIKIFLHDGLYIEQNPDLNEDVKASKWGTHSKVQVYESSDSSEAMIGTYNIDNRSNFYNSEMAVFCKGSDEFTGIVKQEIIDMTKQGIEIKADGSAVDRYGATRSVFGSSKKDLKLMHLIFLPSWLLKFLL